jgi:hypothetical protein
MMTGPTGPAGLSSNFSSCQIPGQPVCNNQEQCFGHPTVAFGPCCFEAGVCNDPLNNQCIPGVEPDDPNLFPPADGPFPALHSFTRDYPKDGCYCATTELLTADDPEGPLEFPNPNPECNLTSVENGVSELACWGTLRCDYFNSSLPANVLCKTKRQCLVRTYLHSQSMRGGKEEGLPLFIHTCNRSCPLRPHPRTPTPSFVHL